MKRVELVFITFPGIGHLISMVELAKLSTGRDEGLSITIVIMKLHGETKVDPYLQSLSKDDTAKRIRLLEIPSQMLDLELFSNSPLSAFDDYVDRQKPHIRDAVTDLFLTSSSPLAGFVIDMFCTTIIDVANELGVPSYIYFTSGAAVLGLMLQLQSLRDDQVLDVSDFKLFDDDLSIPSFSNPVPIKVIPSTVFDKAGGSTCFLNHTKRFRETKGIIVNSFLELETHAINSLSDGSTPPVYPVGPILNLQGGGGSGGNQGTSENTNQHSESPSDGSILSWLDGQPPSSVVFLCFGSMGFFDEEQAKEIAHALERSGHRFLWSLRRPPPMGKRELPADCDNPERILPEGFLQRTSGHGKVIGWAPQMEVLCHPAVGGFVSHCGWNSTLESLWCGVPIATWPMYAEQQLNAFQMVKELAMAVEIKLDYNNDITKKSEVIVTAEEIEVGIRRLMTEDNGHNEIKKKVKKMREKSRMATREGGSSYIYLGRLIEDVIRNLS